MTPGSSFGGRDVCPHVQTGQRKKFMKKIIFTTIQKILIPSRYKLQKLANERVAKITELIKSDLMKNLCDQNLVHLSFDHVTLPIELSSSNREALGVLLSIRYQDSSKTYLLSLEQSESKTADATTEKVQEILKMYNLDRFRI